MAQLKATLVFKELAEIEVEEHSFYKELYPASPDCHACRKPVAPVLSPLMSIKQKKRCIFVHNSWVYRCALQENEQDTNRKTAIYIEEVTNIDAKQIFAQVLLDSMKGCPVEKIPEMRRALILWNGFTTHEEIIRSVFHCTSLWQLSAMFRVAKGTMGYLHELIKKGEWERIYRLAAGKQQSRKSKTNAAHSPSGEGRFSENGNAAEATETMEKDGSGGIDDNAIGTLAADEKALNPLSEYETRPNAQVAASNNSKTPSVKRNKQFKKTLDDNPYLPIFSGDS